MKIQGLTVRRTRCVTTPSRIVLFMFAGTVGCAGASNGEQTGPNLSAAVAGTWQYKGSSTASLAQATGVWSLSARGNLTVEGAVDLTELEPGQVAKRLQGSVAGVLGTTNQFDADVILVSSIRRYSAKRWTDSMDGTWFESDISTGALRATGRFYLVRR